MKVKIAVFALALLILLTGITLNLVVVRLNGGMPFPCAHSSPPTAHSGRIPITEQTKLVFLADIIPFWGYASIGDMLIILGAGVAVIIIVQTRVKCLRRVSRERGKEAQC